MTDQLQAEHAPPTAAATASARHSALRGRFWVACALVLPANMIWCVWTFSVNPMGPWFDEFPLLSNVIVILLGFAGLNALCRRFRPDWAFSQTELLLLYTVLTVSTAVGASFYGQGLAILLAHPMWFGQPGALYEWSAFPQHLPSWLVVSDLEALSGFWQGGSTLYSRVALRAWAVPVLAWTGFITVLVFLTMCLNVLLRRTWVNSEHLTFPIVLLPMEMTRPSGELFRSRLMWVAFALAFGTQLVNGIAYLYPGLPTIPTAPTSIGNLFPDPPWNAMSGLMICFHPLMIGLGCLLPMDILFSSWFLYFVWEGERVLSAVAGFTPAQQESGFPYIHDQAYGGFLVLGVLAVWAARHHLRAAWRHALRPRSLPNAHGLSTGREAESGEAFSDRVACAGLILSSIAVVAFMAASGISLPIAVLMLVLIVVLFTAMTRIRAESGGPILGWIPYLNPALMLIRLAGPQAFAPRRLTAMSLHNWYLQYGWDQPMPYGMEALKMAEESRRSQRRFFIAVVAAAAIGIFGTVFVELNFAYRLGEAAQFNKTGWDVLNIWRRLDIWLSEPTSGNLGAVGGMLLGAGLTLFLAMMRVHHIGWVLHPVPFVTTAVGGWFVGFFWLPFLIAWCIKLVIVRYWGLSGFRKSLPFFFGLIMGEMAGGMMWPLYGLLTNTKCYSFFA